MNEYILLETFEVPREQGKIILTNSPKDTQMYKVIYGADHFNEGTLVYLKCLPTAITQNDKKYYVAEAESVIARVEL